MKEIVLKDAQVRWLERELRFRGLSYGPLQEDLLDHVCLATEEHMSKGMKFADAAEASLRALEPSGIHQIQAKTLDHLKSTTLIRNYLLVAVRNLWKQKWHAALNLLGLTIGLASCLLIFIYIRYEASYDKQHPSKDLYRLVSTLRQGGGQVTETAFTGAPWGPAMVNEFPEILSKARFMKYRLDVRVSYKAADRHFMEPNLIWADQEALQLFDLPLIAGDAQKALAQPNSVVLSEGMAKKYFGDKDPMGEILAYNNEVDLVVRGVMRDMPENMHFKADIIGSFSSLNGFWSVIDNWTILYYYTYFELGEGIDPQVLEAKFPAFFESHLGKEWVLNRSAQLQKVTDIHLRSDRSSELKTNSDINHLYLLGCIAGIILLLACANFINLNIARSLKRAREVGIRKVMGGLRADLVVQFVSESFVLVFFAWILAILAAQALLPFFNSLLGKELGLLNQPDDLLLIYVLGTLFSVSLLAGIFPALSASRAKTVLALKGKFSKEFGGISIKNGLLFFQFTICMALLIAIGTIKLQQNYIMSKDLGYKKEQLLMISTTGIEQHQYDLVKQSLLDLSMVESVSITSHKLAGDQSYHSAYAFTLPGAPLDTLTLGRLHIDHDFVKTYGLELLAGRDLDPRIATDTSAFIINETAVKRLGLQTNEQALNISIDYLTQGEDGRYPRRGRVIGVVRDFHFESLHHNVDGFVMDIQPARYHFFACRVLGQDYQTVVKSMETKLKEVIPALVPDHFWLDEQFEQLYQAENTFEILISIATAIAVSLALLGLLSLVAQLASSRKREVGVRKVLGADSKSIVILFSTRFVRVIVLSFAIAWPLSYWWMDRWLGQFPYRIDMPWYIYVLSSVLLLLLAFITIGTSTMNVARMNPSKSLRYD